jgi:hypothetical protein
VGQSSCWDRNFDEQRRTTLPSCGVVRCAPPVWAAVEAVAEALLDHGELTGRDVRRLVRQALAEHVQAASRTVRHMRIEPA